MSGDGFTHGKCAAFGCPLPGSLGSGGEWVCFCHHGASSAGWQNVTRTIREHKAIAESVVDARRWLGTSQWQSAYRTIRHRLIEANHRDLLPGEVDASPHRPGHPVAVHWLMRLEMHLLSLCSSAADAAQPHPAPPPATQGPAHVSGYLPNASKPNAGDSA